MHYCPTCGHYHGQGDVWVRCLAVLTSETGGASRCACPGHHHSH